MANNEKQEICGMKLPLELHLRETVELFELKHGNLHLSMSSLKRGEVITVEEVRRHGNCQDVFEAGKFRRDGKIYWASVCDLEQYGLVKVQ